jgi:hypothetical protein
LTTTALTACIEGIGVLGPGLPSWPACAAVLAGACEYAAARTLLPTPDVLPSAERRRAGRVIKLALAVGAEALAQSGRKARNLPSVFSSSGGDGDNCHAICETLASHERQISPTRFHNSVHNAAAGYWSIAYGCAEASVTLCAYDASFAAGLLEALLQVTCEARPVLLIAYDADYPPPLHAQRRIPDAFGLSLLLAPAGSQQALASVRVSLCQQAASRLESSELEALRASIPAARGLPLLQLLAQSRSGTVILDYLDTARVAVEIGP